MNNEQIVKNFHIESCVRKNNTYELTATNWRCFRTYTYKYTLTSGFKQYTSNQITRTSETKMAIVFQTLLKVKPNASYMLGKYFTT